MAVVQKSNYTFNTLRKNRTECFESDIQKVYSSYNMALKSIMADEMTIGVFEEIWQSHKMQYIFKCLCEQQSEDEFAQLIYEIILKKYLIYKQKNSKIFAIFALYFLYYACQNRKKINISTKYLDQLRYFVLENRNDKNYHYMKIIYQLHLKCCNISTKIGLRDPIVKGNGQIPRKPPIIKLDPFYCINYIQKQLKEGKGQQKKSLKQSLNSYDKLKNQLFKDASLNKQKFPLDIYFNRRMDQILKSYKQYINNTERNKKKQQQIQ